MTITPQASAVKSLVNCLDDESIIPDITASYAHFIDAKHCWLYGLRFIVHLFCRQTRQEIGVEFGLN
jgi:N-acetylglucosamine-6-phosphate deacetylase